MIGNTPVSPKSPCFVIAEAGVNHNGQLDLAERLVDAAAEAGADAVKFQTFRAEALAARSLVRAPYQQKVGTNSQYEMLKSLELPYEVHEPLKSYCGQRGIEFMSTAYDEESAQFLQQLGVRRIKIASADIVNRPLLEAVAQTGLPVIMSTGMATLAEVERAIDLLSALGAEDIALMHCVSSYPLDVDQVNMGWMSTLRQAFGLPTGYSDTHDGNCDSHYGRQPGRGDDREAPDLGPQYGKVRITQHRWSRMSSTEWCRLSEA